MNDDPKFVLTEPMISNPRDVEVKVGFSQSATYQQLENVHCDSILYTCYFDTRKMN